MHLKLAAEHQKSLNELEVPFKKYDNDIYLSIESIKQDYDKLQEKINIESLIKFEALIFSADFEKIKTVD